jgi:hypothetical protein
MTTHRDATHALGAFQKPCPGDAGMGGWARGFMDEQFVIEQGE